MTDKKQDPHAELMRLAKNMMGASWAEGTPESYESERLALDAFARTLTDRITELEAQLADVETAQPAPAVVEPVQFKGGMTVTDQSRELDAGFAAQNYCRSKWGAARGHAEWRRYHDAFVAGYLAAPNPQQIAEPASQWPDNSCTDQYGNIRVCIGDEVENDDARFFIGAINDSQKLCVLDKSKPWELKNEKTPMAGCIRQGNYAASAITLRRITTTKEPS